MDKPLLWRSDSQVPVLLTLVLLVLLTTAGAKSVWRNRAWLCSAAQSLCSLSDAAWQKRLDPIEQRVTQRCCERRIARARAAVTLFVFICLPWIAVMLLRQFKGTNLMSAWHAAPFEVIMGLSGFLSLCPGAITERTIDVVFVLAILLISAGVVAEGGEDPLKWNIHVSMTAFCTCLFNLKPRINAVGLGIVAVTLAVMNFDEMHAITFSLMFMVFLMLCWIDHTLMDSVRTEILAQNSKGELAAVKTLLGTICDVVVELDNTLCLTQHSESFSDILLRSSGRSMQGMTVQEFMPEEEDRRKFEERVRSADKASAHAEVFHATISDTRGTSISMEFFSVAFAGPDTRRHHLLGMREFTDIAPLAPCPRYRQQALPRAARRRMGAPLSGKSTWRQWVRAAGTPPAVRPLRKQVASL